VVEVVRGEACLDLTLNSHFVDVEDYHVRLVQTEFIPIELTHHHLLTAFFYVLERLLLVDYFLVVIE
jgi:hypothetical protein